MAQRVDSEGPSGSARKRPAEDVTAADKIIELTDNAADGELAALALALEKSLDNVKKRLGQTWYQHKGAKRPGELVYHPEDIYRRDDLSRADRALPKEVREERFGAKVGDRVMPNEEWAAYRKSCGLFGSLETKANLEIVDMRPKRGIIVSLDDDGGTEVSVQWEAGQTSRGLCCGKRCIFTLVYA